ncbi:MAG: TrpB-like pyridoxal phosphate-dependent enzyme [Proteobacteria bacterium]|nr:TrpB-like pyridoxal phosphate-dependent enzyme [Pseudomonadota bacterium]
MAVKKIFLGEEFMPTQWYNLNADFPSPMPPLRDPVTQKLITPDFFKPWSPMSLVAQDVTPERWIDIPEEVLGIYKIWRPTPLYRADGLERLLGYAGKIYFKHEGVSPPGSHKPNTAVAQAYFTQKDGIRRVTTETGAGQWGSALAFATQQFGLELKVYMVRVSYDQKPYRRMMMECWGADCVPSPTEETAAGREILAKDPNSPGSLGIAISEALEVAMNDRDTRYLLGSVTNHVLLHQTVIGLEAKKQFEALGDDPKVVIGCAGGGSNFAGAAFPFVADKIAGQDIRIIAAEPTSCPTMTRGVYHYDFGDTARTAPLLPMHTLGHDFVPAPIHAGGLRYHGMAPMVSHGINLGLIEAQAFDQIETFEAGLTFARAEGFLSAPETNHAVAAVIAAVKRSQEEGRKPTIFFNWSGHGLVDLAAYDAYMSGKLTRYALPQEEIERALRALEELPKVA